MTSASDGDRPRTGGSSRGSRRPSGAMTGDPERRSPNWWASRPARSASGSGSSATRGSMNFGTPHYQGDPGRLAPAQVKRIRQEIETGVFHNADQIRTWIESTFG